MISKDLLINMSSKLEMEGKMQIHEFISYN